MMLHKQVAREAPAPSLLERAADVSHPAVAAEEVLAIANIQGNLLGGFMKDYQMLLFLRVVEVEPFKRWLKSLIPFIATADEVITFNRLFKEMRARRGDSQALKATWINIAFSYHVLTQLCSDASAFTDQAFKEGLWKRSESLGDPMDERAEGHPQNWLVGGPTNEADVMVIVASDDRRDLFDEITRIEASIYGPRTADGRPDRRGAQIIFKQYGANLPGNLSGHEHFGFLDGVSQPGLRGRLSQDAHDVLTSRQNPEDPEQGKPGQDLLWPGEFVFGYYSQDSEKPVEQPGRNSLDGAGPAWAKDGSFLVFRRLRQDVYAFHDFLRQTSQSLHIAPDLLGAKLVGRWPSGAPILRAETEDNAALADNDCANNNFEFQEDASQEVHPDSQGSAQCAEPRRFPTSPGDRTGVICPFAAHIRKVYSRDDVSLDPKNKLPNESDAQTHRLLRRGIPYGEVSRSSLQAPLSDTADRGLLFLAYQTSIERQFEYVTRVLVNNPGFKEPFDAQTRQGAGYDPIIGQNNRDASRRREFIVTFKDDHGVQRREVVSTDKDWVIPTGGGYFFAPSIEALKNTLAG
jgi:Dyp-type peroxidase family